MGKLKHTYEYIKQYFENENCELLETEYINNSTKMKYKCICNNITYIRYSDFQQGKRCSKCGGKKKHTYEFVKQYFKNEGCELLENEYKNNSTKMEYLCNCGNISRINFNNFKNGYRCLKCGGSEKLTFEFVKKFFEDKKCILLETDYVNNNTNMKYICINNHVSFIMFNDFKRGNRCNLCKNKTEKNVNNFLIESNYNIISQAKFDWCKNKRHLPFDFVIDAYKLIIEIDGPQHFKQISNWQSHETTFEVDIFKMKCAIENGYSIIRISQEDIYYNNINWQNELKNNITQYDYPKIIYISQNKNLYDKYQENLNNKTDLD
jgi:very-short-patch-repair endonuclease